MYVPGTASRASDGSFFVFGERENCFERLLAVFTEEFVARHRHLPPTCDRILRPPGSPRSSVNRGATAVHWKSRLLNLVELWGFVTYKISDPYVAHRRREARKLLKLSRLEDNFKNRPRGLRPGDWVC
jgi:hypothetical protein